MSATERLKQQKRSRNDSGASDRSNNSSASEKKKKTDSVKPKPPKPDISLFMECVEDELSEAQKKTYESKQKSFDKVMKDLEEMAKKGATVTPNADNSVTFRVTDSSRAGPLVPSTTATAATTVTSSTNGGVATYTCPPGYRLLMDPKTGRIIGSVPVASLSGGAITNTVNTLAKSNAHLLPRQGAPGLPQVQRQVVRGAKTVQIGRGNMRGAVNMAGRGAGAARGRGMVSIQSRGGARTIARGASMSARGGSTPPSASPARKSEPQVVDLTDPSVEPVGAPAVKFRKAFPALTVQARSQRPVPGASAKRAELDQKVKGLLVLQPAKFTEWLLQNGLVRTEQYEVVNGEKLKLKLGMYSDGKRFASSGGYVWLHSDRSDVKYTSVLKGSIFEIAPTNALKLIYHWCCQTTITNVIQWVKVDNAFVDKFFYMLRAVASICVQEKLQDMGGAGSNIEIGVISLGTSTSGSKREVRVEVLGVLDRATRKMRIRASDPHSVSSDGQAGSVQKERFRKIFEMLTIWVNKESKIFTDFSVDRDTLTQLGFHNVVQCSLQSAPSNNPNTNSQVMDYLKKVVPKMFQNTLSSLNNASLQTFLDELSFRECIGQYPLMSLNSMIEQIEALTKFTANNNEGMEAFLKRVVANPFLDWRLKSGGKPPPVIPRQKSASPAPSTLAGQKRPANQNAVTPVRALAPKPDVRRSATPENPDLLFEKRMKMAKEFIELESYYYGTLQGEDAILAAEFKADMAFKCQICKKVFMNNIEFMKHLHLHIESERQTAIDFADLSQCKFCYKDFDNAIKMQEHIDTVHIIKGFQYVCVICNAGFNTQGALSVHMTTCHVKAEMPYSCQVCGYRTSCHKSIIEHFAEVHDRTDKLQCPLCLKTYSLFNDKGYNSAAAQSYMIHLQKHENLKKKKITCKKCCLEFVNADVLKYHMEKDHLSYKDYSDIDTSQFVLATSAPLKMAKPEEKHYRLAPKRTGPTKAQAQYAFASVNLEDMAIYDTDREKCFECKRPMNSAGHFTAYLCCTKCRYSTCCSRAINLHGLLFHDKPKPEFNLGKPVSLDEEMYCICGFCTKSGNRMAKHLATQSCSTAYGSLEAAGEGRKDKDLPPIERITPRPTPAPSPAPSTGSNTSAALSSGATTPLTSRPPKSKTRKVAPAFLKENPYESDPDNPDSDAPPEDMEDGDENYQPDVAEKYLGSVSRARSEEDVDEPDEPDGKDSDEEMETDKEEEDKESDKVSKLSDDSQGSTASQTAKQDDKDSVKSDDKDEEEKKEEENDEKGDESEDEEENDNEGEKEDNEDEKDDNEEDKDENKEEKEDDNEERSAIINEIMNESENMDTD